MCRNPQHSAREHKKEVSEETKCSFDHVVHSNILEHNTVFPYTISKTKSFNSIISAEDKTSHEGKSWVYSSVPEDFRRMEGTDSIWKKNEDDEVHDAFSRYKNTFPNKWVGIKKCSYYNHPVAVLPALAYNVVTDRMQNKSINVRHKRVGHYDPPNSKQKQSLKYCCNSVQAMTHEEREENNFDKIDMSLSPKVQTKLSPYIDDAISMNRKNNVTVSNGQKDFSNEFSRDVIENQRQDSRKSLKPKLQPQGSTKKLGTNNGDFEETDKFTNIHDYEIKINYSSNSKKKLLNPLHNKNVIRKSNNKQIFFVVSDDPTSLTLNQKHYHEKENYSTKNGMHSHSENNFQSQNADKKSKVWNSRQVELEIPPGFLSPIGSSKPHAGTKIPDNRDNPTDVTEEQYDENESSGNCDKAVNTGDKARWKRFEIKRQSCNTNPTKANPSQHQQKLPIDTANTHANNPKDNSRVMPPRNREISFLKPKNKVFEEQLQNNMQYFDTTDKDNGELLLINTPNSYLLDKSVTNFEHPVLHYSSDYRSEECDLETKEETDPDQSSLCSATSRNSFYTDTKFSDQIYRDMPLVQNDKDIKEDVSWQSNVIFTSVETNGGETNHQNDYDLKYQQNGNAEDESSPCFSAESESERTTGQKYNVFSTEGKANIADHIAHSFPYSKYGDALSQQQNRNCKEDIHSIEILTQHVADNDIYRNTTRLSDHLSHHRNHDRSGNEKTDIEGNTQNYEMANYKAAHDHPKFHINVGNKKKPKSIPHTKKDDVNHDRSRNEERDEEDNLQNFRIADFRGAHYHPKFQSKVADTKKSDFSPTKNKKRMNTEKIPHISRGVNEKYFTKAMPQNFSPYAITRPLINERLPGTKMNRGNLIGNNIRPRTCKEGSVTKETYYFPVRGQETVNNLPNNNEGGDKISSNDEYRNTDRITHYSIQDTRGFKEKERHQCILEKELHANKNSLEELKGFNYVYENHSRTKTKDMVSKFPVNVDMYSSKEEGDLKQESKSNLEPNQGKFNADTEFEFFSKALFPNTDMNYSQRPDYNSHFQGTHLNKSKLNVNALEKTEDLNLDLRDDTLQLQIEEYMSKMLGKYGLAEMNVSSSKNKDWGHMNKTTNQLDDYSGGREHTGINSNVNENKSNKIKLQTKIKLPGKNYKEGDNTVQYNNIHNRYHSRNNLKVVKHSKAKEYYDEEEGEDSTNVAYKSNDENSSVKEAAMSLGDTEGKLLLTAGVREGAEQSQGKNIVFKVSDIGDFAEKRKEYIQEGKDVRILKENSEDVGKKTAWPSLLDKVIPFKREKLNEFEKYQERNRKHGVNEWKSGNIYNYFIPTGNKFLSNDKQVSDHNNYTSDSEEQTLFEKFYNQKLPLDQKLEAEEYQLLENLNGKERQRQGFKNPILHENNKGSKFTILTKFQGPPSMDTLYKSDTTHSSHENNFNRPSHNHGVLEILRPSNEIKYSRDDDNDYYYYYYYQQSADAKSHSHRAIKIAPEKHSHLESLNYSSLENYAYLMTQYEKGCKCTYNDVMKPPSNNKQTNHLYEDVGYIDRMNKV
jgi:hypothetical protein